MNGRKNNVVSRIFATLTHWQRKKNRTAKKQLNTLCAVSAAKVISHRSSHLKNKTFFSISRSFAFAGSSVLATPLLMSLILYL